MSAGMHPCCVYHKLPERLRWIAADFDAMEEELRRQLPEGTRRELGLEMLRMARWQLITAGLEEEDGGKVQPR